MIKVNCERSINKLLVSLFPRIFVCQAEITTTPTTNTTPTSTTTPTTTTSTTTPSNIDVLFTNPYCKPAEGLAWNINNYDYKTYNPPHNNWYWAIRWPTDINEKYGCTPENSKCFVNSVKLGFSKWDTENGGHKICFANFEESVEEALKNDNPNDPIARIYKDNKLVAVVRRREPWRGGIHEALQEKVIVPANMLTCK